MGNSFSENKVSIIVPIYNVGEYLTACIESILSQDYINTEVILVDDGSSDNSSEICDNYAALHSNIVVIHKMNGGVSSARNMGLDNATGDYITFVDGDDTISKNAISIMIKEIETHRADICVFPKIRIGNKIVTAWNINKGLYSNYECIDFLANQNFPTSLWCCIYKKSIINNQRLSISIHHLEDLEFQFRLLCKAKNVYVSDSVVNNYVQRPGSANTSGITDKLMSCLKVEKTIKSYVAKDRRLKSEYVGLIRFRLVMTICSKYIQSNGSDKKLEKFFIKTARSSFWDVIKCRNKKIKIQCILVSALFKPYVHMYRMKHHFGSV
ncbi:glycosyltransferase family 2 protein [Ruminococcus flavefaciens]|uniref:glycosyltransferase family 2 protein n=1 Tax=Ruminococcus flavefaciens TaxID=1265 RepID=UPI0004AFBDA3|nr:glycosyltransferase [Ruminococcus flavefaciens]